MEKRQEWHNIVVEMMIEQRTKGISGFDRDILEWSIPEEVLAVLLKDRSTGRNLIWATNDYAARGKSKTMERG